MALNIPTLKSYELTVQELQLCLPADSQFLRFIIRDIDRPLRQTREVPLIDRQRTVSQQQIVRFSLDSHKQSAILCILAVTLSNVVYVGAIIIDLSQKFRKIKQEISLCANQEGYVIYSLQDSIVSVVNSPQSAYGSGESPKDGSQPPQQHIIAQWKQEQLLLVPQVSQQQSQSALSNLENIMFNESSVGEFHQNHSLKQTNSIRSMDSPNNQEVAALQLQLQQLLQQNAELRQSLEEQQLICKTQHSHLLQINQKLLADYEQLLSQNNTAKIMYENELNQLRQQLETRTLSTSVENSQKMEVYLLNQRLKVQMALNNIQAIEIQHVKMEIESLIDDMERRQECRQPEINEGIDYRLQLEMMLRLNNYLKSEVLSKHLMEHLASSGANVNNYRESILTFLTRLKIEQIFCL